jgi:hypothetical protein
MFYLEGAIKYGHGWRTITTSYAHRQNIEMDKTRVRRGNVQWKRLHVLNNPSKLAFKEWEEVPKPWKYANCEEYIEWCHINKKIPSRAA